MQLSPPEKAAIHEIWNRGLTVSEVWKSYTSSHPDRLITVSAALSEYLESRRRAGRQARYVDQLRRELRYWNEAIGPSTPLIQSSTFDHHLFLSRWSTPTAATIARRLRGFYSWCVRNDYLSRSPLNSLEPIAGEDPTISIVSNRRCESLLRACLETDPDLFWWFWAALGLGVRVCELPGLEFANGLVIVPAGSAKTKRRRPISVPPFMEPIPQKGGVTNLRKRREAVARVAGFRPARNALRHTAASHLVNYYASAEAASLQLGNSPKILHRHYRGLVSATQTEDWVKIWGSVMAGQTA